MVNHEIVTVAVLLVGGDVNYADTEDVAKKANEIAPERFAWKKYKDQINIENIRAFLSDATKPKNGAYLRGSGKQGWMLTPAGLAYATKELNSLNKKALTRPRETNDERAIGRWRERERARLLSSKSLDLWIAGEAKQLTRTDAEAFFRVDDYTTGKTREGRLQRVINLCVEEKNTDLVGLATFLARKLGD